MKKIADILTFELEAAFEKAGYDKQYAKVTLSNRPDLCEYQCNGAMAAAKAYKKAPIMIANDVVEVLKESVCIEQVEAVNPGFINIILDGEFVASYLGKMSEQEKLEFVKQLLPEGIVLTDTRMTELKQEKVENSKPDTENSAVSTNEPTNKASQAAVKELPAKKKSSLPRPMALSVEKSPSMSYKKPKSAKQKKREKDDELMKRTKDGKRNSRKRKKRK